MFRFRDAQNNGQTKQTETVQGAGLYFWGTSAAPTMYIAPMQCANKLQSHNNNKTHNKCSLVCVACDFMKYIFALEVNRLLYQRTGWDGMHWLVLFQAALITTTCSGKWAPPWKTILIDRSIDDCK